MRLQPWPLGISQICVGVTSALFCPDASHRPKVTKCFSTLTADISSTSHAILFKVSGVPGNDEKGLQLNFGGHRVAGAPPSGGYVRRWRFFEKSTEFRFFAHFRKNPDQVSQNPKKIDFFAQKPKNRFCGIVFPVDPKQSQFTDF